MALLKTTSSIQFRHTVRPSPVSLTFKCLNLLKKMPVLENVTFTVYNNFVFLSTFLVFELKVRMRHTDKRTKMQRYCCRFTRHFELLSPKIWRTSTLITLKLKFCQGAACHLQKKLLLLFVTNYNVNPS